MTPYALNFLLNLLLVAGGIFTLYSAWFVLVALFGFKKQKEYEETDSTTRFAVLVAARNEQAVIGQLVDSLQAQHYPKEKYEIIVAPNNCTDDTRTVAKAHGATIFDPVGIIHGKGDVLAQLCDTVAASGRFDAICVLDADNLAHPDFLQSMNDAYNAGAHVAQGFRDSKNPADTAISTCYSVCYWMANRFYNAGRAALGLSGMVNGSGFMMSVDMLRRLGGWCTGTMTEDYEITAQVVMQGERVYYVPAARIYDEQPLTFRQSWKQRRRWSTGCVQGMELYLGALLRYAKEKRSAVALDLAFTYLTPVVQLLSLLVGGATLLLNLYGVVQFSLVPLAGFVTTLALGLLGAFLLCCCVAAFMVRSNRRGLMGTGKGILFFAFFLLSCMPISIISLFKGQTTWDPIAHTRAIGMGEL